MRRSVFWKVAGVLVGAQVLTGLLAVGLSALLWEAQSLELVQNSLALRLDVVAEEVEARAIFDPDAPDPADRVLLPEALRRDLAARFPDPVYLLDPAGDPVDPLAPVPPTAYDLLDFGRVVVELQDDPPWALVPLFDPDGVPAGGLLVRPLAASLERERAGTREATRRALAIVGFLALGSALVLGALLTLRLVAPLRRMTARIEAIGAGDYTARLAADRDDEIGRLAAAINHMASQVEASIDALRATDRLRRELVANIGHDLRTPLAALQGYVEEAERRLQEGRADDAAQALATAAGQGRHIEALVRDLFELSILDAHHDRPPLHREPVPVPELLHHAAAAHRRAFAEAGLTFDIDAAADLPTIEADGVRLLRLLDNLLDNALRHTPPGGTVRLVATSAGGTLEVRVEDTGEGIEHAAVGHVFDRYYRGETARTRGREGSGLGLAIARAIARAHGGDLSVESRPGEGSTFTLHLPIEADGDAFPADA
jgi:signal transduction histidine kinase